MRGLLFVLVFLFLIPQVLGAERDELQLQALVLQERLGRLQAEYILAQIQQKEVNAKIEFLIKKEKENNGETKPDKGL